MSPIISIDDLLAGVQTILGEARAEPYTGQLAVAWVLINRLKRPEYFKADSIYKVCHAPLQFSMWNNSPDNNLEITMGIQLMSPAFLTALHALLGAITGVAPDPTNGADHYHTIAKPGYASVWPPKWADNSKWTTTLNAHRFYKLASK